jgi:hypothetical protein
MDRFLKPRRATCTAATGCPGIPAQGLDNYDSLAAIAWQVHVYGTAKDSLVRWCAARGIPLHVFQWATEHSRAGLACDAAYLLRPDTYVAELRNTANL